MSKCIPDGSGPSAVMGPLFRAPGVTRRRLLEQAALAGAAAAGLGSLLAWGAPAAADTTNPSSPADLDAARKEGTLAVLHGDQEADVVAFLKSFTEKTGIAAQEVRMLPGVALPKLAAEFRTGATDLDVYQTSDAGLMDDLRLQGHVQRYLSPELKGFDRRYKSTPEGYWTAYFINVGTVMYDPRYVRKEEAPKSFEDLLKPEWAHQVGFQDASAGSQYAWWYVLQDVLPADYWDRLAQQKPRAYASSTQMMQDLHSGDLKIGGKVSIFQYPKSVRQHQPIEVIFPAQGTPAQSQVVGILGGTRRSNAAKAYIDYLLSKEGQQRWNEIQGSYSPRSDVSISGLPSLAHVKLLLPTNFARYRSVAEHQKFVKMWNAVVGF
ncbi:MAG: extracellular solute-binding protein [Rhizobiaceae bacterium]|nr:MAG: extracellular solute-binding protein [Rhizobiaceae bacterium]